MKKFENFSIICSIIFLCNAISFIKKNKLLISENLVLFGIADIAFQLSVALLFLLSWKFIRCKKNNSLHFFRAGCISSIIYIIAKGLEAAATANEAGIDLIYTIPIIAIGCFLVASIFLYFLIISLNKVGCDI